MKNDEEASTSEAPPPLSRPSGAPDDTLGLVHQLRTLGEIGLRRAYGEVFGTPSGRLVLADIQRVAGVAHIRPAGLSRDDRSYHDGRAALALQIANTARFDEASLAVMALNDTLEGQENAGYADRRGGTGDDDGRDLGSDGEPILD